MSDLHGSVRDAVLVVDLPGRVIYSNLPAEALTGRRRDDLLGRPLASVFAMAAEAVSRMTEHAIEERRQIGPVVGWIFDRSRTRRITVECHAAPIHGRDGHVSGAVLVFRELLFPSA